MKASSFLSISILISLLIIISSFQLNHASSLSNLIRRSCKQATKSDPEILHYDFCIQTLESNRKAKTATTLDELTLVSIELAMSNTTKIVSNISNLLKKSVKLKGSNKASIIYHYYSKGCLEGCLELYSDAVSNLKEGLSAVKSKDYDTANIKLSAAMDAPITCEDGFKEKKGMVSPLTKMNDVFFQFAAISLAFINMCGGN